MAVADIAQRTEPAQAAKVQRLLHIAADAIAAAASVKADPPRPEPACGVFFVAKLEAAQRKVGAPAALVAPPG